jgi:hypothetical protein
MAYFQCSSTDKNGLHVPLGCVIDYRGFRLIAVSVLPISGEGSLKYGSNDAAKTVNKEIPVINQKMEEAAKILNLKGHYVGTKDDKKILHAPVDIECHIGKDGRFYILDFARTFPPEHPMFKPPEKGCYLYRILRPELVRKSPFPLSRCLVSIWERCT